MHAGRTLGARESDESAAQAGRNSDGMLDASGIARWIVQGKESPNCIATWELVAGGSEAYVGKTIFVDTCHAHTVVEKFLNGIIELLSIPNICRRSAMINEVSDAHERLHMTIADVCPTVKEYVDKQTAYLAALTGRFAHKPNKPVQVPQASMDDKADEKADEEVSHEDDVPASGAAAGCCFLLSVSLYDHMLRTDCRRSVSICQDGLQSD